MAEYGVTEQDFEGISSSLRNTKGVQIAIFLNGLEEGGYKASLRSNGANVAELAACYGGGGHVRAAGATIKDGTIEEIIESLVMNSEKVLL